MCQQLSEIEAKISKVNSELTRHVNDGTLTIGIKAMIDAERDTLYLDRRDHKFLGHQGRGCPDA